MEWTKLKMAKSEQNSNQTKRERVLASD